jgi:hypothetical protein
MKIYINNNYEIKAINQSEDTSLQEIDIDREQVFGDKSDFIILNYCYKPSENGYSVYPSMDYNILKLLDTQIISKLSLLEEENHALKQELMLMKMEV